MVLDAVTNTPIPGARVQVAGKWQAASAAGTLQAELDPGILSYRAEAAGYLFAPEPFTATPTVALPANLTTTTTISLWPSRALSGPGSIAGRVTVDGAPVAGALVVATSAVEGYAYTDDDGQYLITRLNAGEYRVKAWKAGHEGVEKTRVMVNAASEGVDLTMTVGAPGSVTGAVTGGTTKVWLTHPTTHQPIPGLATDAAGGAYSIGGVPAGTYRVRAGLENDGRSLDPDPIHEDGPIEVTVAAAAVTQNLALLPAIAGLSPTETASAARTPAFNWSSVPNADFYVLEVYDLDGVSLTGGFDATGNPRTRILQRPFTYNGPALTPGSRYRWRVWAGENDPVVASEFKLIAASEELYGVFVVRR